MRVVGGTARGRTLKTVSTAGTRSTSDKVRGAIFDVLAPFLSAHTRVLDLYAGTGALGIEAVSRGAAHACFVEQNAQCCGVIRANLDLCGMTGAGRVLCVAVAQGLATLEKELSSTGGVRYDLIVMDPPYDDPHIDAVLRRVADGPLVSPGGLVVLEHTKRRALGGDLPRLVSWRTKTYGDTAVSFWRRGEDSGERDQGHLPGQF